MEGEFLEFKKDQLVCKQGEELHDIYKVISGKLFICTSKGTMVTPLAIIKKGEFFGEMSFFTKHPRIANAIALEDTQLVKISSTKYKESIPQWVHQLIKNVVLDISKLNQIIAEKGIRKTIDESVKPLSIEEQRHYHNLIKES